MDHQRQRVKLATQLLSRTCANAINYLGERKVLKSKNWKETSDFIFLIDEWFDLLNSRNQYGEIGKSNAFGIELEKQVSTLN